MKRVAMLFSGQGAQFVGMGKSSYDRCDNAKQVFEIAMRYRKDIIDLCFYGDKDALSLTIDAQPALFCAGLADAYAYLEDNEVDIGAVSGFSVGEMPALVLAGVLGVADGFELVCKRAEYMQECAQNNPGSMAAVLGIDYQTVEKAVEDIDDLWCANYNSPQQVVVAGKLDSFVQLQEALPKAKLIRLNVSGAFHTPYMFDASQRLKEYLESIQLSKPKYPLYSNIDGKLYSDDLSDIRERIIQQIVSPVRWMQVVDSMLDSGVVDYCEVGAGNVLRGLVSKIAQARGVQITTNQ